MEIKLKPYQVLALGFFSYIILGVILISLPVSQKVHVSFIDNLFNVTSAMSTTGIVTASISEIYTPFGLFILMSLFQLGAIGYMTLTSFFILSRNEKISNARIKILSAEFAMPEFFEIKKFVKNIIIFTILSEFIGAMLLWCNFH